MSGSNDDEEEQDEDGKWTGDDRDQEPDEAQVSKERGGKKRGAVKSGGNARKSVASSKAKAAIRSVQTAKPPAKKVIAYTLSSATHTLNAYSCNNTDGVAFDVLHGNVLVSGGGATRIAVAGLPGQKLVIIDRFYIDARYRGDKLNRHGAEAMSLLCRLYIDAGTSVLKVVNPTGKGRKFYIRCGFTKDPCGDLIFSSPL